MDGGIFLTMAHREEDREWRQEDREWRQQDREWRQEDRQWRRQDRAWRQEDRKWRRNDRRFRILDDARRKTDEWVELINDISNVSALLAGFATAALVEAPLEGVYDCYENGYTTADCVDYDDTELSQWTVMVFAVSTSLVAALMMANVLACTTTATLLIQNYHKLPWMQHHELWSMLSRRWFWIVIRFYCGVFFSYVSLSTIVLVKFADHAITAWASFSCVAAIGFWAIHDICGPFAVCDMMGCICCPSIVRRYLGCCCSMNCYAILSTRIERTYRKNPLKQYHGADDGAFHFEEVEEPLEPGASMLSGVDLDDYRVHVTRAQQNFPSTRGPRPQGSPGKSAEDTIAASDGNNDTTGTAEQSPDT